MLPNLYFLLKVKMVQYLLIQSEPMFFSTLSRKLQKKHTIIHFSIISRCNQKIKIIESLYNDRVDPNTNKVIIIGSRGTGRDYGVENVQAAMKTAIKKIRTAGSKDLANHLTKYLLDNKDIYLPPPDFHEWHVEV